MEDLSFNDNIPYIVQKKTYQVEDIVPLHCARTIEVLACDGLIGEMTINNVHCPFSGKQVFVIPPYVIHANNIHPCAGVMYQFQSDFDALRSYIDIRAILHFDNIHISELSHQIPEYERISMLISRLIEKDDDFPQCITLVSELFNTLRKYRSIPTQQESRLNITKNEIMRDTIVWTQEHFAEKITLDKVAKRSGYSKFHFCSRFKESTGMTYIDFLNSVRVSNSCNYLRENFTVFEAGRRCGFNTASYFTQVFHNIHGVTPKEYQNNVRKLTEG